MRPKLGADVSRYGVALITLIMCVLGVVGYFGMQKESFHLDELYTYGFANGYDHPFINPEDDMMKWHTSSYYNDYLTVQADQRFAYGSIYDTQSKDWHPPLYSFCIHTICSFFPNSFSKWYGIGFNMLFLSGTLLILYRFSLLLVNNKPLALITCAAYGLSAGAISSALFIRMYMMLIFFTLFTTYLHGLLVVKQKDLTRLMIVIAGVNIVGFLTHYLYATYAIIIACCYSVYLLKHRRYSEMTIYGAFMLCSAALSVILFPACLHMLSVNVESVVNSAGAGGYFIKVMLFTWILTEDLFGGPTLPLIIVLSFATILFLRKINPVRVVIDSGVGKEQRSFLLILIVAACLTFLGNVKISPYQDSWRYVYNLYPIIVLTAVTFIWIFIDSLNDRRTIFTNSMVIGIICFSIGISLSQGKVDYLYRGKAENLSSIMSAYNKYPALCVSEDTHNMTIAIPLLKLHQKSCYVATGSVAQDVSIMFAKDEQTLPTWGPFVLYVPHWNSVQESDSDILDNLMENAGFNSYTKMFNKRESGLSTNVYLVE